MEKFCGSAPRGDDTNYGLRGIIATFLYERLIPYTMVAPQSWKKAVAGNGRADKATVKAAVERILRSSFPAKLPIGGKHLAFRDDASDAAAIALFGAMQTGAQDAPVPITAPRLIAV